MWIAVGATHGRLKQSSRPRWGRTETVKLATPVSHFITTCQRSPAAGAEERSGKAPENGKAIFYKLAPRERAKLAWIMAPA
jgi:hypothetical protein